MGTPSNPPENYFLGNPLGCAPLQTNMHRHAPALLQRKMPHRIKQNRVLKFCAASHTITPSGEPLPLRGVARLRQPPATHFKVSKTNKLGLYDVENVLHPNFTGHPEANTCEQGCIGGDRLLLSRTEQIQFKLLTRENVPAPAPTAKYAQSSATRHPS